MGSYKKSQLNAIHPSDEYYAEARYCLSHGKSLLDFDSWVALEEALGRKIPYQDYAKIDAYLDEMILDYTPEELRRAACFALEED